MYDVIVIGGGAIGCTIGRYLSKYDIKLALLEKNMEVCQETTKANSAIVHAGYDPEPNTLKAKLNVRGNKLYPKLAKDLDFVFNMCGSLVLAFSEEEMETVKELYDRGIKNGVEGISIIGLDEIRKIEPRVSDKVVGALYSSSAGVVDPFNYTYAMIENAMENGLELFLETKVIGLNKKDGYIEVVSDKGIFETKYVINAAGLYSDKISKMAGDDDYYIIPTKGVYRLLDKRKDDVIHTVLFQTPTKEGKGVLVTSTYDGNTMIGPTNTTIKSVEDTTTDEASLHKIDSLAKKSIPDIDTRNTIRIFTGIRAKPNTGDFMIYPSKNMKGFIHVGGIESPGLASAPGIGEYVIELLESIGFEYKLKDNFINTRKRIEKVNELSKEELIEKIKENPLYGKIICRCETVSEAEIVEAIHRNAGARCVDGVKRRVRAGMGRCQGGFCGPRVLEILARELNIDMVDVKKELSGSEIAYSHLKEN